MQAVDGITARVQVLVEIVDHHLGAAEDDPEAEVVDVDEAGEGLQFRAPVDFDVGLFHLGRLAGDGVDAQPGRIPAEALDEVLDRPRHRGREAQHLAGGGRGGQNPLDVVAEAHIEHPVGLVEHHHPEGVETEGATGEVVEDPPGRSDHDLGSGLQGPELPVVTLPAVDRNLADSPAEERQPARLLGHLHRQFPRRAQDQGLDRLLVGVDPLDDRDGEGGGLARARGGLAHQVAAREGDRDHRSLDGRGFLEAELGDRAEDLGREAELVKGTTFHTAACGWSRRKDSQMMRPRPRRPVRAPRSARCGTRTSSRPYRGFGSQAGRRRQTSGRYTRRPSGR